MSKPLRGEIVEIEVYDQRYWLRLATSAERDEILSLAERVDLRMREIAKKTGTVDSLKVAILTALHLAQDVRDKEAVPDTRLENAISRGSRKWIAEIEKAL